MLPALLIAVGLWPNVLVDKDGVVMVAYCDGERGDAMLAVETPSGWRVETADSVGAVGKYMTAALGPAGPELLYLDQGRHVLRHAARRAGTWHVEDVLRAEGEVGVAGRFLISPSGERTLLHFNHKFELLITQLKDKWTTRVLGRVAGTHRAHIGAYYDADDVLHISYADENIGSPGLYLSTVTDKLVINDAISVVAPQTELVGGQPYYITRGHYGEDTLVSGLYKPFPIAEHVRDFRALTLAGGVPVLALTIGEVAPGCDGIRWGSPICPANAGGGKLALAWRTGNGWQQMPLDDVNVTDFSIAQRDDVVHVAYFDGDQLKHVATQIFLRAGKRD